MAQLKHTTGNVAQIEKTPLGSEQIVGLAVATNLTPIAGATSAVIQVLGQNVRMRAYSGDTPTPTDGIQLVAGTIIVWDADLAEISFIEEAASATLEVEYLA